MDQAKRLKELEKENGKLKRLVAEPSAVPTNSEFSLADRADAITNSFVQKMILDFLIEQGGAGQHRSSVDAQPPPQIAHQRRCRAPLLLVVDNYAFVARLTQIPPRFRNGTSVAA